MEFLSSQRDVDPVKPVCIKSQSAGVCVIQVFKDEHQVSKAAAPSTLNKSEGQHIINHIILLENTFGDVVFPAFHHYNVQYVM